MADKRRRAGVAGETRATLASNPITRHFFSSSFGSFIRRSELQTVRRAREQHIPFSPCKGGRKSRPGCNPNHLQHLSNSNSSSSSTFCWFLEAPASKPPMDAKTTPAPADKPSALPRPALSKLPLPRPRLQLHSDPPDVPTKPANPPSRTVKKPSIASVPRSSQPSAKAASSTSKPATALPGLSNGTRNVAKPSIRGTVASRAAPQTRKPSASLARPSLTAEDEENNDQLASLDTFRSASRQGSRMAFREDSPTDTLDSVEPAELSLNGRNRRPSRPSLSDRTVESLQTIPSTPKERRRSSFFNPVESPMGPPPRPGSSLSRNGSGSNGSRPGTSDGTFPKPLSRPSSPGKRASASAQPSTRTTSRLPNLGSMSSTGRSISGSFTSKLQQAQAPSSKRNSTPAKRPAVTNGIASKIGAGNKTIASSRPAKPRPALGEAFRPSQKPTTENAANEATLAEPKREVSNSSAALRQQIAAAKAAARKEKAIKHDSPQDLSASIDMGKLEEQLHPDPFNQAPRDEKHILRNRINAARIDGKLNIAAMGLKEIPDEVRNMYSSAAMEESRVNWAEVVDLTKLIAADNDFERFDDTVFPDLSPEELNADDQTEGNQFGGLEVLDVHGNSLQALPIGLRRLERLTKLDIAHNKLDSAVFDVVAQIKSIKELKLGHNGLTGNVPTSICELPHLETLDLQANRLLSLPEALRELVNLRVLNVSGNQLTALPMDALQQIPLVELDAGGNALIASLFPLGGPNGHPTLQVLNAANNSLAALTFTEPLVLPQLRSLNITNNHMTVLPAVTGWTELLILLAGDNKVAELPQGFTTLQKLRNVNFTSNELRIIDPEIAKMSSLESLMLASNPLREKKFLTMNATDIKRDLRARLATTEPEETASDLEEPESPVTVIGDFERPASVWSLKGNGVLDLASKGLSDDFNDLLESFFDSNEVKAIDLQSNRITYIPPALGVGRFLRTLDLSDNLLGAEYVFDQLELPSLQEINLSKCRLVSLEPILTHLAAPGLQTLNISANRLSGPIPSLRQTYPGLTTLFANDNKFISVSADALRGMRAVNLDSNDIDQLPAEIGLLWDEGLRSFSVGRNAFRVPNYRVLDKGTEATLRWLRDKLPVSGSTFKDTHELD